MRQRLSVFFFGFLLGILSFYLVSFISPGGEAVFSPENGDELIRFIDEAQQSLDIEVYLFTSKDLYDAVLRAHERGVRIRILLEAKEANDEVYRSLLWKGIPVRFYSKKLHAKFIIRDGKDVFVGSHNFSYSALKKNREASVILSSEKVVRNFIDVFEKDWESSSLSTPSP